MKKIINKIPVGVFSVIATVIVVYLLLVPSDRVGGGWFKNHDKIAHFCMFFFLNCVYLYDYTKKKNPRHTKINKELVFTSLAAMLGLLTESAQLAMGLGRNFDVLDILADVAGAFAALGVMKWFGSHLLRKYLFNSKSRHHHHHHSHKKTQKG